MIEFKTLRYKNILSSGNTFTEIPLNLHKSSLVVGLNGAGKSTMLDALTFCLFGKPFRKITKGELINSRNGKKLLTEVEFSIGSKEYLIRRGSKPEVLEIFLDGKEINKEASKAEQQKIIDNKILRMSYKTFCQVVIVGKTNYTAFMSLTAPERRTFIENLLDIEIFSRMNDDLKKRIKDNKENILRGEKERDILDTKIEALKDKRDSLTKVNDEQIKKINEKAREEKKVLDEAKAEKISLQESVEALQEKLEGEKKIELQYSQVDELLRDLRSKIRDHERPIKFLHDNDTCPTCKQGIHEDFKQDTISEHQSEIETLNEKVVKYEKAFEKANEIREGFKKIHGEIRDIESKISNEEYRESMAKRNLLALKKEKEDLEKKAEDDFEEELNSLEKEYLTSKNKVVKLYRDKETYALSYELLKDSGIKSQIIKQYVPLINKVINAYLGEMDMFIDFAFDENFNESIQSRGKDLFKYNNFSEGEKARIDLALLFTWRDISRMRNPVTANLLIMDEVDGSADHDCVAALHKIVKRFTDSNLFIISHSEITKELFSDDNIMKFEKVKGFSRYVE